MCNSLAEGGQRCPAHTRPKVTKAAKAVEAAIQQAATTGDYAPVAAARDAWEQAAAEYASTNEGREHFKAQAAAADAAGNIDTAAMLNTVVTKGEALRAANRETAALLAAVRMGEAPAPQGPMVPGLAAMAVAPAATPPTVPDLSPRDREAWDQAVADLREMNTGIQTYGTGATPEQVLAGLEDLDTTLADPDASDADLAAALRGMDRARSVLGYSPTTHVDTRSRTARGRVFETPEDEREHTEAMERWRQWTSKHLYYFHKPQYARALAHPGAGVVTYRTLAQEDALTQVVSAQPTCPPETLNTLLRRDRSPGSDSTTSVHPDGWERARTIRMEPGNEALAVTLACTDPDTFQRHEALHQVMTMPLESLHQTDRAWLVANLHKIPGPHNQEALARSMVAYAKGYADDVEKEHLRTLFTGDRFDPLPGEGSPHRGAAAAAQQNNELSPALRQIGAEIAPVHPAPAAAEGRKRGLFSRA